MAERRIIEINELVDKARLNRFHFLLVAMVMLILWVDGTDFAAANVAAPQITKALGVDRGAMGQVFGAGNFGILLGSLMFGYVGDQLGRKVGAIGGVLAYSLPAILVLFAHSVEQLVILRFIAGLGIGGVIPNVIALLNESAPRRIRATFVVCGFVGYSLGSFTSALIVGHLSPLLGWQTPFVIAGGVGVILAGLLSQTLPESVRYLALRQPDSEKTRALLRRIAPGVAIDATTRLVIHVPPAGKYAITDLFRGERRMSTPLLWVGYFADSLTYMTLISWFTTLLADQGVSATDAANTYSWGALIGIVGGLALARPIDRFGPLTTVATALVGMAGILTLALADMTISTRLLVACTTYAVCNVTHNSLNAAVGSFYPTSMRAKGVGWATGMGRVALTLGPLITGYLLAAKLPSSQVLQLIAAPYVVVICMCLVLGVLWRQRMTIAAAEPTGTPAAQV